MKTTIINKILLVLMLITAQQVSALEFQVDGIYYRTSIFTKNSAYVTHSGTSYTESVEYQGEVVIPESVTYNGKTYTIASIGGYAFAGCPGLTSVTIPNTVTTINQNAFNGCTGLKTIECKATTPPALGDNAFTSYDATLVVPSSSESAYKSAAGWSNFKFKEEPSETPGSGENSGEDNTGGGSDSGEDNGSDSGSDNGSDNSGSDNTYGLTCNIINSTDVEIIAGTEKYTGDIVIPSQVIISGKTYNVTKIGERAFDGCAGLTSITIPNSVTSIGDYAFYSCTGLTSIEIPSSITSIGNYFAFNSGLTRVVIPNSVTSIGNSAFWNCFGLTSIAIPNSVTSIGDSAFVLCTGLTSVEIPNSVTSIGTLAFYGCSGLTSVTIGNSVTGIGESAFADCTGLTSVTSLSTTPPTCGTDVFKNVNIANIPLTIPAGSESLYKATEPWKNFKYDETTDEPELPTDTSGLSYNIISDTEVEVIAATEKYSGDIVIPSQTTIEGKAYNVTKIADEAFYACSGLKTITIPNSVTSIGNYVLGNCPNLTSIVVESGNKKYDSRNNCNAIIETSTNSLIAGCKNSVIPSSVTTIGTASFMGCTGLTSITIPSSVVSLGEDAFYECTGLTSMTIPNSVTSIGDNVFAYCSNLKTITLSTNIKTISYSAFLDCYSLTSITVPNSVITIEEEAFCGCDGLADVIIGNSVASIGNHAFLNCGGLTSVTMLNSTPPSCGTDVFKNVNVSNVTLTVPTGSVSIYKSADIWKDFKYEQTEEEPSEPEIPTDNSGLSYNILNSTEVEVIAGAEKYTGDIVIPSQTTIDGKVYNVTQIGDAAFQDCTNLTSVTIPNLVVSIGESALKGCINLISVVIGNSVTSIGNSAFYGCTSLTSVTIPNSVTSIGIYAFAFCSGLTSITIPNSVTSIGYYAFQNCSGLTSVIIGSSVTSIDNFAFYYCSGLTSVTSLNTTPPTCGTSVFGNVSVGNITLEVPSVSVSLYQSADIWKRFGTIKGIVVEESGGSDNEEIISGYKITKQWTVPADATTGFCSVRTATGYGDSLFGSNYQAGVIEEWKGGVLVASYDVNKFCADNNLGETVKVKDEAGNETEKFQSYLLWTAVMVDDAGNLLVNVGTVLAAPNTCQNWVLLPASDRNAMQLLHIDEFPSADVTPGRVDVPSRIVGNITDGGAYLYIPATNSALMPVMYIALDGDGKIYYDAENSWILMSSVTFDSSTNVATFQTAEDILNATDEAGVAAKTYVRWRGQVALFTWNAETSQFEKNTAIPQGDASTPGMGIFEINEVQYIVVPVKSATNGTRGSSVAVYNLADGTEVASWDSLGAVDYYIGSVTARANEDGTAYIYVAGHKDCFGILKFETEKVASTQNSELSYGAGDASIIEVILIEKDEVEYFTLQGVKVVNPAHGLYIRKQGNKVTKVVL